MKKLLSLLPILFLCLSTRAATEVIKISAFPNTATLNGTDLLLIAIPGVTNKNITWNQFRAQIGTNGSTVNNFQFITNITLYSTNIDVTYITNNTEYTTNLYVSTNYAYTSIVTNLYVTNLTAQYITNNTTYTTNLFVTDITTNFFLFSTNIYNSDVIVSNYFITNVFNDSFVSNFFVTNQIFYETNQYLTFISTTNFIDYITNNYVSNFFNTNIFVSNNYVSNYFVTNFFPLYEITSNYTFNVAWPLTNATLYGTTTFSPISGPSPGRIVLLSAAGATVISLTASNGAVSAGTGLFTNLTAGSYVGVGANGQLINTDAPPVNLSTLNYYFTSNNLFVSNAYITNINANKATITNVTIVAGYVLTNAWAGPTNTIDMTMQDQGYASFTAVSITGLINRSNNVVQSVMLTLTNKTATNWLLTLPAGLVIPERTNQVTVSNASQGMISIRYHPAFGSNAVYRQF